MIYFYCVLDICHSVRCHHEASVYNEHRVQTNRNVSYFRFSPLGKVTAFSGGKGALNAGSVDEPDNDFVNAATNEGLVPDGSTGPWSATLDNLE